MPNGPDRRAKSAKRMGESSPALQCWDQIRGKLVSPHRGRLRFVRLSSGTRSRTDSVVRFPDSRLKQTRDPSDESLGYSHSSAWRTVFCYTLPYNSVNSLKREATSLVSASALTRHDQFPSVLLGRFMRASVPRPNTSCKGTTAVFATDASTARMKSQLISSPSVCRYFRQNSFSRSICFASRVDPAPATLENQPTAVSLSCVPV